MIEPAINEREAANALDVSVYCMSAWRARGKGPAWIRVGRLAKYLESDLQAFRESGRVQPWATGRRNKSSVRREDTGKPGAMRSSRRLVGDHENSDHEIPSRAPEHSKQRGESAR